MQKASAAQLMCATDVLRLRPVALPIAKPSIAGAVISLTIPLFPSLSLQVKERLLFEQKRMAAVESRKRSKAAAVFAKQTQAETLKAKQAEKRAQLDAVKQWRKHKGGATSGGVGSRTTNAEIEAMLANTGTGGGDGAEAGPTGAGAGAGTHRGAGFGSGKRRAGKDRRYGFGGQKRHAKENTKGSSGSLASFNPSANRALPPGMRHGKGKGGGPGGGKGFKPRGGGKRNTGANRPGKRARAAAHGKG